MKKVAKAALMTAFLFPFSLPAWAGPSADAVWRQAAIDKVAAQRTTPRSAQLRKSKGVAQMEVRVDAAGMITDYRLIQSSGEPILDREADMILFRVGSFTATPNGQPTRLVIPIRW